MYGHAKVENLAAAIEGMLILVGAGIIIFEAVRRLAEGSEALHSLGFGIAVVAISTVVNLGVSTYLYRQARAHDSPALEGDAAHLRADALTSLAVLAGLVLVAVTGIEELDAVIALVVAGAIVYAGITILTRSSRVLVDEALPQEELDIVRQAIDAYPGRRAGQLPQAARPPCRQRALHRPPPPVRIRHHARARTRDRARAPGPGPLTDPRRRAARSPRASTAARREDQARDADG